MSVASRHLRAGDAGGVDSRRGARPGWAGDRKSTRLNSSHANISYAVFCLKKKKKTINNDSVNSSDILSTKTIIHRAIPTYYYVSHSTLKSRSTILKFLHYTFT